MKPVPELEMELHELEQVRLRLISRGFLTITIEAAIEEVQRDLALAQTRQQLRNVLFEEVVDITGLGTLRNEKINQIIEAVLSRVAEE